MASPEARRAFRDAATGESMNPGRSDGFYCARSIFVVFAYIRIKIIPEIKIQP